MRSDAKGPRIWLRRDERRSEWIIRDGKRQIRTGCSAGDRASAERRLADYLRDKHEAPRTLRSPDVIPVADVIAIYLADRAPRQARPAETAMRAQALLAWWGERKLSQVTAQACREYADSRSTPAAARRELEDLRAAINHHRAEKLCAEVVTVTLPPKSVPRERWLTRPEAARLLRAAWRNKRTRHVAKFILVALYTGTRAGAVCGAAFRQTPGRGWVDVEAGTFHRRSSGSVEGKKRRPPVALSYRILAHIRRWRACDPGARYVVEWRGRPVTRVTKAFDTAAVAAGLNAPLPAAGPGKPRRSRDREGAVTPHVLRHTAATWLMQAGVEPWQAAGLLGMSVETLLNVYGHHHPDRQKATADLLARGGKR